jgi:3,4-dihydroxy-2-butanone 4-phosphate synthase
MIATIKEHARPLALGECVIVFDDVNRESQQAAPQVARQSRVYLLDSDRGLVHVFASRHPYTWI